MLVLTRKLGESIVIDKDIRIVVSAIHGKRVRLSIGAPATVKVVRQEMQERRALPANVQGPDLKAACPSS
jgi:carbon storage regulator